MAETKTNIPVEIKMGNAGTNDANLPAFKEGSIIFTKDTKKIYIDPVGETERIAVGGSESVYKAKGSIADISALPTPDKAHEGFVYNIENEFTTTDQFVEGAGKTFPAGTNVVCINTTGTTYKWDVLAGMVDLSGYVTTEDLANGLAGKQDMITTSTNLVAGTVTAEAGRHVLVMNNDSIDFTDRLISQEKPSVSIAMSGYRAGSSVTPADVRFSSYAQITTALQNPYVTLSGIANPTSNDQAANKKYVDTNFQPKLVSGTNIATINGKSLLDGGNITIEGGGSSITVDTELSATSTNPVQNKVINSALSNKQDKFADLNYVWSDSGNSVNQLSLVLKSASHTTSTGGVVSLIPKLSLTNEVGQDVRLTGIAAPTADNDAANKAYVDTQVATKQAKFAEYTSTRPSEEAPASASTNILVLNEGMEFYLRDRATNPLVEFKINSSGALEGTTNYFSLTSKGAFNLKSNVFALSNDKGTPFQVVMDDDSKKVVYYGLSGGDDNGSLYLTNTSRTGQQGATLQGNVSSDSRTTALVVNESNTKLLSWKQGTTTNNAPLLGVATPVTVEDTTLGITTADLPYQAVNKKYVDDIKTELLKAINHPYTYDETTKELTLIL